MYSATLIEERNEILRRYKEILTILEDRINKEQRVEIRKAFKLALIAHKDMRRKSGEPYIYHPLEVARIGASDIGLGASSIICAFLHDVVEDTDYTLDHIKEIFGETVMQIIDGLTKIEEVMDLNNPSMQAENFKKILLTLAYDVRVILIKLADRLHNMRTLDSMKPEKQLKIASETAYFYAPLAHRLGLYSIKIELENLSLKYTEPDIYNNITQKIAETKEERELFIKEFAAPIIEKLNSEGLKYEIISRVKSANSIWQKMIKKNISFEEVYDLFAFRIIIDSSYENEKSDSWKVYTLVTSIYIPKPDRLRDWISIPKANGYESLHTTVMSNSGRWVEVQIRSKRMNEIAEKGYAAHWKYKGLNVSEKNFEQGLDEWLEKIKDVLKSNDCNALDFLSNIKLDIFSDEIFVFTPKGEMKTLPKKSTILDFAYTVHSQLGNNCIGAKVNHTLVPLNYILKSGDQIQIITSKKQVPQEEWIDFVATSKAREAIKNALKDLKKIEIENGRLIFEDNITFENEKTKQATLQKILNKTNSKNPNELFYKIGSNKIAISDIVKIKDKKNNRFIDYFTLRPIIKIRKNVKTLNEILLNQLKNKPETLLLDENIEKILYTISKCCNPIPGDQVVGFITSSTNIDIHRTNCSEAIKSMSNFGNKIIKAKWLNEDAISVLAGLKIIGIDRKGLLKESIDIISESMNLNMRSINFESSEGVFEGLIMVYIKDLNSLNNLITKLKKVKGIQKINRINSYDI